MARLPFRPTRLPRPRPVPTVSPTPAPTAAPNNAFTLTTNIETLPAAGVTAAANAVFTAPAGVTPQGVQANTLQSGDVLNGSGGTNVLNATFVTAGVIAPTINNIPTVNVQALAAFNLDPLAPPVTSLNLGASTGITTIGDVNSVANVAITGVKSALTTLNKSGGISRNTEVIFQNNVLNGPANAIAINLDGIDGGNIRLEAATPSSTNGYETFNVNAVTDSSIGRLISGGSLDNINVSGGNLSIRGAAGADAIERQVLNFNASAQSGSLTVGRIDNGVGLTQGASVVNASQEDLNFVGSNNGTTVFVEAASLGQGDVLNGGAGAGGNLVLTGAARIAGSASTVVQGNNSAFAATGFETLTITDTAGNGVAARANNNPAAFNLANVSGVNTVQLGTASSAVVGLTNLQYTSPLAINVTGNGESTVNAGNGVNAVFFGAFGENDTVNYTFGNRGRTINSNSVLTLGQLSLPNIENVSLTFNDLSSTTTQAYGSFTGQPVTTLFGNSSSLRFLTLNAQSGEDAAGSINLGTLGTDTAAVVGTVRGAVINSNSGVTAAFANNAGASFEVTGAGDHNLTVQSRTTIADATINAGTASGDLTLAVRNEAVVNGRGLLTGGSGDDTVTGGSNNDVLTGNAGNDSITGNDGIDVISGGDNNDFLLGLAGNDVITGGNGVDSFRYTTAATSVGSGVGNNTTNVDQITDFTSGTDNIGLRRGTAGNTALGANIVLDGTSTAAPLLGNVVDATSVATLADVYAAIGANAAFTGGAFAATAVGPGANQIIAKTISFANGGSAGTYLVVNDNVNGFQGANDLVIALGTGGVVPVAAADIVTFA